MVRKFVAGMARMPILLVVSLAVMAVGLVLAFRPAPAQAATYASPWWVVTAGTQEKVCAGCGCEMPSPIVEPGVSVLTGELVLDIPFASTQTMLGTQTLAVRARGMITGGTEFGLGMIPSWMTTVQETIHNVGNPLANGGHSALVRLPTGVTVNFIWGGSAYGTSDCCFHDTLSKNGSGRYVLTALDGSTKLFDANGMPDVYTDANGNTTDYTYNGSLQCTGWTNDRGVSSTVNHDANGWVSSVVVDGLFTYAFVINSSGYLTSITTPTTPDQGSGIVIAPQYDGSNRITAIRDGNGNDPYVYSYVGATEQVSYATGSTITFSYNTNRTDVTDRNGNVIRYHYSGRDVTKVEQWISGASAFATNYTYSGGDLIKIVKPRGNRIDFTVNGNGQVTERRQKETDTNSNSASDIVESWAYTSNFVTSYTDPRGYTTTYTRDAAGNVTAINYPTVTSPTTQSSVSKSFTYNARGQKTQATDEEGKIVEYSYYASGSNKYGLLWKVKVDPSGLNLVTEYLYNGQAQLQSIKDPLNKQTGYVFDAVGRKTKVTTPTGIETEWHYDGNGQVTSMDVENLDQAGTRVSGNEWLTTSYTYNSHGSMLTMTEEIDGSTTRTTSFDYDDNQNRIRVTKPEGNKEKWTYNSRDLVATHVRGETSGVASTTTYTYDDNGNLTVLEDGRGNDTTYTYDLFDRRTKTTNALGHYEETDYDKGGNVTEVRRYDATPTPDVLLQRSTRSYDQRGRHWQTSDLHKDPSTTYSDAVTTIERFKTGHVRYFTDPRSKVTETQYDNAWRVTKTIDAMGNEAANTYDAASRRTAWSLLEKDGGSSVTHSYEASYDDDGRMTQRREVDRTNGSNVYTTDYLYDSRGNLLWTVNAEGNPTRFTYDGVGRMTKKEVALAVGSPITTFTSAIVTEWAFDKNNRLTSFKDDAANTSTWTYDAKDRVSTMVYPNTSQDVLYTYDANDNVIELTDPAGNFIEDTFDALNRNTARDVTLVSGFNDTTTESRTFDALNRLTENEDDDYRVTYTYGVRGLGSTVYQEAQEYSTGTAYTKTVTTKYDAAGNRTSQVYPSGLALTYAYNDINALSSVTDGTNTIASFSYIGFRPKVTTFGNGATQTNTYGGFREDLTTVHHETSAPATLVRMDYGYNKVHDRTYERFGASGSAGDAFEYDKARRLTKAWMGSSTPASPSGNTYVQTIAYNMDDDGNRSSVVVTPYGVSPTTTSYSANNLNQYTAVGGTSQSYDANGNLTNNGTLTFKYSYKNLITEVRQSSGGALVAEYLYDANGRRVVKNVNGGIFERYIYADLEAISVLDGSQAWKQDFVFDVTGIDRVLMLEQADVLDQDSDSNTTEITRSYYHRNALGSVMEISTASQTEAASYRYTPYGEMTITRGGTVQSSDPLGQRLGFSGRTMDFESSLVCFSTASASAESGRFLQRVWPQATDGRRDYDLRVERGVALTTTDIAFDGLAFAVQAIMDQWMDAGWISGIDDPVWLLRYRDVEEHFGTPVITKRVIDCAKVPGFKKPPGWTCTCYETVRTVRHTIHYADRGEIRVRQLEVYGAFMRGSRNDDSHDHITKTYSARCVESPVTPSDDVPCGPRLPAEIEGLSEDVMRFFNSGPKRELPPASNPKAKPGATPSEPFKAPDNRGR